MRNTVLWLCVVCLMAASGCANFTAIDKPLSHWDPNPGKPLGEQFSGDRSPELLVLVAFSGGGTRAAAFSYGVLQELARTEVTTEKGTRSLLNEVDVISSVSGGSFTSAYYGLRGERIFEEFEERFLRKNIEGDLFLEVFKPANWFRLPSSGFGKSDMAAEYYDRHVFEAATFADLRRPNAPVLVINTTDLATGIRFPFTHAIFDLMCADLDSYPVSRAVAASSAVPVLLSPITLKNYAGSCGYEPPTWLGAALRDEENLERRMGARDLEDYLDPRRRPWLHLVDGGIADNLGLRSFVNMFSAEGDVHRSLHDIQHPEVRRVLIISVNAHANPDAEWALERKAPRLAAVIGGITSDQITRYSIDSLAITRYAFEKWMEEISTPARPVTFDFVEVSFDAVKDASERRFLNNIGTNFNLKDEQIDRLISAAGEVLRESPELRAFLTKTEGQGIRQ